MRITRLLWIVCAVTSLNCEAPSGTAPARPAGVPARAFWNGGADGGVFLYLDKKAGAPPLVYDVTVYNDFTGDVWFKGKMKLSAPRELDARALRSTETFSGWDGERLYLVDGRFLSKSTR